MVTSDNGPWFEGSTGGLRGNKLHLDRFPHDPNRAHGKELPQLFNLELGPAETYDLRHGHPDVLEHLTSLAAHFEDAIAGQRLAAEARAAGRATPPSPV
ncbi:hypothetical protein [Flindersiella endophytica]